jgi:hypothetical protein
VQKLGPEYLAAKAAFDSGERSDSLNLNNATRTRLQLLSTALVLLTVFGIVVTLGLSIGFGLRMGRRLRRLVANATLLARHKQRAGSARRRSRSVVSVAHQSANRRAGRKWSRLLADVQRHLEAFRAAHRRRESRQRGFAVGSNGSAP